MKFLSVKHLVIGIAMTAAASLGVVLKPTHSLAGPGAEINLETLLPKQFGEWRADEAVSAAIINPQVAAELNEIYSQTLSRTYINARGERIMLSLAYGGDQSRNMQVHRPEVCYASQGFKISHMTKAVLRPDYGQIPIMRVVATYGSRNEPITYWVRIGEKLVRGNLEQGFARLAYGLQGKIPDGLLFRVSNITPDSEAGFRLQQQFVIDLLAALPAKNRQQLVGAAQP